MRLSTPILSTCLALCAAYVAYPYLALYRLGSAIHEGNAAALESMVDWSSVREGIKEDICDNGGGADSASDKDALPGFGAGFVRGIAANAVGQQVTPQAILAAVHATEAAPAHGGAHGGADMQVNWAFFDSPTGFLVSLQAPGQAAPIKMQLELQDARWHVIRVWLPPKLLEVANQRT